MIYKTRIIILILDFILQVLASIQQKQSTTGHTKLDNIRISLAQTNSFIKMLSNYQKILTLLSQTLNPSTNKQAQSQLKRLGVQDLNPTLACLYHALTDPTLYISLSNSTSSVYKANNRSISKAKLGQMRTLVTSYINQIFVENISEIQQAYGFKYLTTVLEDSRIELTHKKQLCRSIMYCLQQCDQQYLQIWKKYTHSMLAKTDPTTHQCQMGLLLLSSFACTQIQDNIAKQINTPILDGVMTVLLFKLQKIDEIILGKNEPNTEQSGTVHDSDQMGDEQDQRRNKQHQIWAQAQYIIQVFKIAAQFLIYMDKFLAKSIFIKWSKSFHLVKCLQQIYSHLSSSQGQHVFYLPISPDEFIQPITSLKISALNLHNLVLGHILSHSQPIVPNTTEGPSKKITILPLFQFTGMNLNLFVQSLCLVNLRQDIAQIVSQLQLQQMLILMLKIIRQMGVFAPEMIIKSWKQMLHFVIFPFLQIREQEIENFQESTADFVELNEDCFEKQSSGQLKSQAACFLQKIADMSNQIWQSISNETNSQIQSNIPELPPYQQISQKYPINFALTSLKHHLQMQQQPKDIYIFNQKVPQSAKLLSIQCSFFVLTVFSYCLQYYKQQMEELRVIMCNQRVRAFPPLERARIYTFLAYNYQELFCHAKNGESVRFWQKLALKQEMHPTVNYCALDFLNNTLYKLYNQQLVAQIFKKIPKTTAPNFWPLLKKALQIHLPKLNQPLLICLISQCYTRLQSEISYLHSRTDNSLPITHVITQILHIIRSLSQKGHFLKQKNQLRGALWEVTQLYEIGRKFYFDQEIIKIINCFLYWANEEEIRSPQINTWVAVYIRDFQKNQFQGLGYFIGFANFVVKGGFEGYAREIYSILRKAINKFLGNGIDKKQGTGRKLAIAHTLLIIQNIVALYGQNFAQNELQYLYNVVYSLYPKQIQVKIPLNQSNISESQMGDKSVIKKKLSIYDRTLLCRALNLQLLCHIHSKSPQLDPLPSLSQYHHLKLYYSYDVTVLLACLKVLILRQINIQRLVNMLEILITVVHVYMGVQLEVQSLEQKQKQKLRQKYEDDADKDPEHKQNDEENERKNRKLSSLKIRIKRVSDYQHILSYITTPFTTNQSFNPNNPPKMLSPFTPSPYPAPKPIKHTRQIRLQLIAMFNSLLLSNGPLIQSILLGFSDQIKERLETVFQCKITDILCGKLTIIAKNLASNGKGISKMDDKKQGSDKRKKLVVIRMKNGPIQQHPLIQNKQQDRNKTNANNELQLQQQEQQEYSKRRDRHMLFKQDGNDENQSNEEDNGKQFQLFDNPFNEDKYSEDQSRMNMRKKKMQKKKKI